MRGFGTTAPATSSIRAMLSPFMIFCSTVPGHFSQDDLVHKNQTGMIQEIAKSESIARIEEVVGAVATNPLTPVGYQWQSIIYKHPPA